MYSTPQQEGKMLNIVETDTKSTYKELRKDFVLQLVQNANQV